MRDHGKVSPQFWVGDTGKRIRRIGPETQVVALYLMSSPHANMLGLYYLPVLFLSHETGIPLEGASEALRSLEEAGFCSYDHDAEVVWVHEMARHQVGSELKETDNRVAGIRSALKTVPKNRFLDEWMQRYGSAYHISPSEGPYKPHRSKEKEKEKEKEKKPNTSAGADNSYPQEFEQAYHEMPKRRPSHNKKAAYEAWKARVNQGAEPLELAEGAKRYAKYIRSTGKENTEFVMMASTFFGPKEHYLQPWEVPEGEAGEEDWMRGAI